ncbi:MAG TPA: class I SAM-dependent methyltransferase [Polyangiaceae bacterium]|jgi:SAM-dependent methyltransferase|nr:class I SAM-dependent methyltransferase [Polyangiaceae bacterium]
MSSPVCNVCGASSNGSEEQTSVRSNVRVFRDERFEYWRCKSCGSIHAKDDVDLAHYYSRYPFHGLAMDWRLKAMYARQVARLVAAGVKRTDRILDYGCGGGQLVHYMRSLGFANVRGYDEYSAEYGDKSVLADRYDCVVSQDVVEHVPEPHALLERFQELTRPGAVVALGTPSAGAIDLARPEEFVHTIHAPYHRHILSKDALVSAGSRQGWTLSRYYPTMYSNTHVPFLNEAFYYYYTRITDGTLDALMEPVRVGALLLRAPMTLFWGLFGYFFSRHTDVMAIFKRG